ncbi:response regulator [Oceanispirochaeta sp.]|jgi:two-component system response regulator YesN|uniref:response regulator transcription factor n=1 Tax=Oceanispirochaeta sp. TaxID=2035350 RepID=UPI00261F70D1|nr:response regulator [Oceanispirochaeta sp.]MDA3957120.1 response regulator [Oceanispirochaeta sp.]
MYRVMIVDDEEPVLDSFSFILKKYVNDFTLCAKARTGTEAIKEIKEKNPDVVFMDIQMPGMDGIETIRQLRPLFPHIIFILATAYERFDIAQKAIQLGVFNYLVKPVSKNKILEVLDLVKEDLDKRKKESDTLLEDEQFLKRTKNEKLNKFLTSLIWKNPDADSWNDFCRLFSINCERAAISLIGGLSTVSEEIRRDIFGSLVQKIQYKYNCLSTELGDKLILFFPEEGEMKDLDRQLRLIINEVNKVNLLLGSGGSYHFSEITRSVSEAFRPFSDSKEIEDKRNREQRMIFSVFKGILSNDRNKGEELFKNFWVSKFKQNEFNVAKGKMVALFTLLLHDIENHLLIRSNFNIDPAEEIMPLKTMEEWDLWAASAMTELFNLLDLQKSQTYPKPLKKALSYIAGNYSHQLQLTSVADECSVTGSYLSRLFTEHLDTKFIDYLNRYRVNQAVLLLRDKNISIKEASFMVGYQNPNYFSRIFRKIMGISPSDL